MKLQAKLSKLQELTEDAVKEKMFEIADDAVNITLTSSNANTGKVGAVDTGAYITSFSFNVGAGRPRGKSSRRKTKNANLSSVASIARDQLYSDISKLNFKGSTSITLRNNSPHAYLVEHKHGYKIFAQLRGKHG